MSHFNPGLISAYNSLTDKHLTGYFSSTRIRRHLQRAGLITRSGRIVPDKEYRHKLIQRAHQRHVRECLAQAIFLKVLEMERLHQMEIKKKLEEFARRERVHKMKVERSKRFEEDIQIMLPHPPMGARAVRKQHSGPVGGHYGSSESPGSSRPNTAPGNMQRPVRLKPIHNNTTSSNRRSSPHQLHEAFIDNHLSFNRTMERKPRKHTTTSDTSHGISPYCLPVVNNFVMPLPPTTKRKERGPSGTPSSTLRRRRRLLRPATGSSGAEVNEEQPLLRTTVLQSKVCVTMVYFGKSVHLSHDLDDLRDEVKVFQQHCGGENLCVYKGRLREGETFHFVSRRHPGFPFSLTFFLNGLQVERLSSCCEFKHRKGPRLGGRHGHFGFTAVERASPCYKCIIAMGLDKKPTPPPKKVKENVTGEESSFSLKDAPVMETGSASRSGCESSSPQEQQTQDEHRDDYEEDFEADDDKSNEKKPSSSTSETDVQTKDEASSDFEDNKTDEEDVRPHSSSSSSEESDAEDEEEIEEPKEVLQRQETSPPVEKDQGNPQVTDTESAEVKGSQVEDSGEVSDTSVPTSDEKEQTADTSEERKEGEEAEDGGDQEEQERAKSVQEKLAEAILTESRFSSEPELSDTSTEEEEEEPLVSKNQGQKPENDVAVMEKSVTTCEESVSKNHEEPRRQAESQPQENEEHEEVKEEDHEEKIPEGDKTLEHQDDALAISTDGELNKKAAADAASETTETKEEKQEGLGGVVTHGAEVSTEIPTDIKEEDNVNDENSNVEAIEATEEKETSKVFEEINDQVAKYEERAEKSCEDTNRENQAEENLNKVENIAEETNTDANNEETKKDAAEANLIEEQTQRDDSNGLKSTEAEGEHEEKDTKEINPTNTDDGEGSEARQKDKNEAVESNDVTDKDENEQILAAGLKESQEINKATTEDAEESEVRQKEADDASKNVEEKIVTAKNEEDEEINAEKNKDVMDQTEEEKINTDEIEEREETSKKDESKAEIRDRDGDEEVNIQSAESEETNKANTDNIEEKYENENEAVMGKAEEEKVITNEAEEREETSRKDENEAEAGQDFRERAEEEKMEAEEDEETNKVNTDNVEEIEEKDTNKKKDVMDEAEEVLVTNETEEREETTEKDNEDEECKDFRERNDNEEREDDVGEETNKANMYNVEDSEARDKNKNRVVTVEDEEEATNETEERGDASKDVRGTHVEEKLEAKEGVEENEEKNKNTDVEDKAEEKKMAEEIEETSKINSEELEKMSEQHLENVEVMSMTEEIHKAPMKDKNKRSEVDAENGETSTRGEDNQDEPNKSDGETSEHLEEERKDKSVEVKKNYEESGDTHKLEGDGKEVVTNDRFELALVELIEDFKSDDLNSNGQDGKAEKTNNHPKTDYSTGGYDQNSAAEATDLNKTADKLHSEDNLPSTKKVASTEKSRWTVEASKGSAEGASVLLQPQSIKDQPTNSRHGESPEVLARASSAELVTKWLTMHQASKFFETYVDPLEDLTDSEVGVSMEARKSSETLIREAVDSDEVKFKSKTKGDAQSQCERIHLKDDEPCEKVTNVEVEDKVQVLIPNTDSELTATDAKAKLSENQGFLSDDTVESTDGNIADTFQNKVESMSGTKPSSVMEKETEATNHSPKTENDDDKHEWKPADDDQTTPDGRAHKECQEVTSEKA
ncbi:glutamate-rich protein 3 isoform X2 [Dunckerocampus dactyliophorus]|uniref:glutamate-rich protein 3 isoform X2 n=1 Tax=Dunckerocampus dactyliophorus TaxID=161453 RepID=UPI0024075439|nr:glutamate-rich protein 3 isoform X2 [Dunckerocampus dactyliophorus]